MEWLKELIQQLIFGAIEVGGKTIAVLGGGVDYIYPKENKELYMKIIDSGGAIISEYPLGTEPDSEKFKQRNRLVSGLSLGVLIVEAEFRSGTSITARHAVEQGRDIYCIPSSRENRKGIGTNNLIKKGAKLVLEPKEILEKYNLKIKKQITIEELDKNNITNTFRLNNVKEEYKEIYKILTRPMSIDEICIETGLDVTDVYSKMLMMELEKLVTKSGNKYTICLKEER